MFINILSKIAIIDETHGLIVTKEKMVVYFSTPGLFLDLERLQQMQNEDRVEDHVQRARSVISEGLSKRRSQLNLDRTESVESANAMRRLNYTQSVHSVSSMQSYIRESLINEFEPTGSQITNNLRTQSRTQSQDVSQPFSRPEDLAQGLTDTEPDAGRATCKEKVIAFLDNPWYQGFLVLFNLFAILVSFFLDNAYEYSALEVLHFWKRSSFLVNSVYFLDLTLNIIFEGVPRIYEAKKWLLVELFQQASCLYVYYVDFRSGDAPEIQHGANIIMRVYFIRFIRIAEFFTELQQFKIILSTLRKFTLPFFFTMVNLYTIFFTYAYWGEYMWGGKVTTNSVQTSDPSLPALYYLMNFNDFGSSMVTLFHVMVVNNWFITCNMYIDITGNAYPKVFFVSFWILTVLIIFNLVISNVIEIYDSVEADVSESFRINWSAQQLSGLNRDQLRDLVVKAQDQER